MKKLIIPAIIISTLAMTSCKQEKPAPVLHEKVEASVPVKLPEVPDFDSVLQQVVPSKNNTYTTWAAVFNQDKLLNTEIRISGKIVEVSDDCPELTLPKSKQTAQQKQSGHHKKNKKDKTPPPAQETTPIQCPGLSVTINSPDDHNYPIMITGYHPFYHPHLKPGMTMDVTGKYVLFGNSFIDARNGLLMISEFHNMGVDRTGKFSTKRSEIQEMIANDSLLVTRYKKNDSDDAAINNQQNNKPK